TLELRVQSDRPGERLRGAVAVAVRETDDGEVVEDLGEHPGLLLGARRRHLLVAQRLREPLLGERGPGPVPLVVHERHAHEPAHLDDRMGMVVHAEVDGAVREAAVSPPLRATRSAIDCRPRLSPPAASPATIASYRRVASGFPLPSRNAFSIAAT